MIYLLHFDRPYKNAREYRATRHRFLLVEGKSTLEIFNRLAAEVMEAGVEYSIVKCWAQGNADVYEQLIGRKNAALICPLCRKESGRKPEYRRRIPKGFDLKGLKSDGQSE